MFLCTRECGCESEQLWGQWGCVSLHQSVCVCVCVWGMLISYFIVSILQFAWAVSSVLMHELQQQENQTRPGLWSPILGLEIIPPCQRKKQGCSPRTSLPSIVTLSRTGLHYEAFQRAYSLCQVPGVVSPERAAYSVLARISILPWQAKVWFCSPFPFVSSHIRCFDFTRNPGSLWAPLTFGQGSDGRED